MIVIDDKIVSADVLSKQFVCDLQRCKGACCVQGDGGAPLEAHERALLPEIYPHVAEYLSEEGKETIASNGFFTHDETENVYATPLRPSDSACAYVNFDENGITYCGIEKAYEAGKITFQKPVSCHLYPIRVTKYDGFEAVNYESWDICAPACSLGQSLQVPVYRFLQGPLIRKYGEEFYAALDAAAHHMNEATDS
ncbi:MAG: DUF3109 family protein [Saprospiraceae bacterium]|nr:DUF3109 family protein [Saprospiraceae bacterium]